MYCRHVLERAVLLQVLAEGTLNTASNLRSLLLYIDSFLDRTSKYFYFDEGTSGIPGIIVRIAVNSKLYLVEWKRSQSRVAIATTNVEL